MKELSPNTEVFLFDKWRVRVVVREDKPWFVAKDIAEALGYDWHGSGTVGHVPEKWRGVQSIGTPSGNQQVLLLSLEGLFFFLNRSDKPAAFPFQEWVNGTVLPEIHRTGSYSAVKKALKLPAGVQLHEMRMIYGDKEAGKRLDFLLGYGQPKTLEAPETPATPEEGAAAFAAMDARFPKPGLPDGTVGKVVRAAAGATRATLARIDAKAKRDALQPLLSEARP